MKWNDFRKAECGPGAAAEIEQPAKAKKKAAATDDDAKGLTTRQCSAKYQAAKEAGTLGEMKWNDFRKAECGPGATTASDTKTKKTAAKSDENDDAKGLTMKECGTKYQAAKKRVPSAIRNGTTSARRNAARAPPWRSGRRSPPRRLPRPIPRAG